MDYEIIQSTNPDFNKAIVRVNIFREHRQTIQVYILFFHTTEYSKVLKNWETLHHYFSISPKWKMMVFRCPNI